MIASSKGLHMKPIYFFVLASPVENRNTLRLCTIHVMYQPLPDTRYAWATTVVYIMDSMTGRQHNNRYDRAAAKICID